MKITTPGLLTVTQEHDYGRYKAHGYEWISFQHWNRGQRGPIDWAGDYDLSKARAAGLEPGVWAVIYEDEDGASWGIAENAAGRAMRLHAAHLMFDIEYATSAVPVIEGARAGGWTEPIHLTCLGAPTKKNATEYWDYGYDLKSFLDTGGGIFPQAYANQHPGYAPRDCVLYYQRQLGVPKDRLNLMIWPNGQPLTGEDWVLLLESAELGPAMSVFLAETTSLQDMTTLEAVTKSDLVLEPAPPDDSGLDPRLPQIAHDTLIELEAATASYEKWAAANPGELNAVNTYLARIVDWKSGPLPSPPNLKTHKGRGIVGLLQAGAATIGRLP